MIVRAFYYRCNIKEYHLSQYLIIEKIVQPILKIFSVFLYVSHHLRAFNITSILGWFILHLQNLRTGLLRFVQGFYELEVFIFTTVLLRFFILRLPSVLSLGKGNQTCELKFEDFPSHPQYDPPGDSSFSVVTSLGFESL